MASDERVLGGGSFVERLMEEVEEGERETLRSGGRRRQVSRARRPACRGIRMAVREMNCPAAQVARFPGATTAAVVRAASAFEPETQPTAQ